jgi:hypothetical protein
MSRETLAPIFDEPDDPSGSSGSQKSEVRSERAPSHAGEGIGNKQLSEIIGVPKSTIEKWKSALKRGEPIESRAYPNFCTEWAIGSDGLWYRRESIDLTRRSTP